jgi:hypothetical protein
MAVRKERPLPVAYSGAARSEIVALPDSRIENPIPLTRMFLRVFSQLFSYESNNYLLFQPWIDRGGVVDRLRVFFALQ